MEPIARCPHGVVTTIDCAVCERAAKERAALLTWFARCDLSAYPTGALDAAYKALTEYDEPTIDDASRKSTLRDSPAAKRKP